MMNRFAQSDLPTTQLAPREKTPATEHTETLARILDPIAFEPLPQDPNLGQVWEQICRQGSARKHAEGALRAGYRPLTEDQG